MYWETIKSTSSRADLTWDLTCILFIDWLRIWNLWLIYRKISKTNQIIQAKWFNVVHLLVRIPSGALYRKKDVIKDISFTVEMNALNKMDMLFFDLFTGMSSITFRGGILLCLYRRCLSTLVGFSISFSTIPTKSKQEKQRMTWRATFINVKDLDLVKQLRACYSVHVIYFPLVSSRVVLNLH